MTDNPDLWRTDGPGRTTGPPERRRTADYTERVMVPT